MANHYWLMVTNEAGELIAEQYFADNLAAAQQAKDELNLHLHTLYVWIDGAM